MYCNESIHSYLYEELYIDCPFCYKLIQTPNLQIHTCCNNMYIINNEFCFICKICGSVYGYQLAREYIDFYENRYRIKRKSVYNRKYHLQNKIMSLCSQYAIQTSYNNEQKILDIF